MRDICEEGTTMRRGLLVVIAALAALMMMAVPSAAQERFPVSIGVTYGTFAPSLDAYNLRYIEQTNPNVIVAPDGSESIVQVRRRLDNIAAPITVNPGHPNEYVADQQPFLFGSSWGLGVQARVRLHSDAYALVESDWWKQEVGSIRRFGPVSGYESTELKLNPITASLVYELPTEQGKVWMPQLYVGGGFGAILVERNTTQITTSTPVGGQISSASGSGMILTGIAGLEYPFWFLNNRVSLFAEGRYLAGTYNEAFPSIDALGNRRFDAVTGEGLVDEEEVSIQGPQMKFGMSVNFGQVRTRAARGVLTGVIESRARRGFAMAPSGYGAPPMGLAAVYPQPSDQVHVVHGPAQIDENRIRQIIREELVSTRVTKVPGTVAVDDLAEQQLRSIRERRLQAEQELEQLKDLLREEG